MTKKKQKKKQTYCTALNEWGGVEMALKVKVDKIEKLIHS